MVNGHPNPGTDEAVLNGCTCEVGGLYGNNNGYHIVDWDCPLHGEALKKRVREEAHGNQISRNP